MLAVLYTLLLYIYIFVYLVFIRQFCIRNSTLSTKCREDFNDIFFYTFQSLCDLERYTDADFVKRKNSRKNLSAPQIRENLNGQTRENFDGRVWLASALVSIRSWPSQLPPVGSSLSCQQLRKKGHAFFSVLLTPPK